MCLDFKAMVGELEVDFKRPSFADSSSAKAVAAGKGVRTRRRLRAQSLRARQNVLDREISVRGVPGKENPSDAGTKRLDQASMWGCSDKVGQIASVGNSKLPLQAAP